MIEKVLKTKLKACAKFLVLTLYLNKCVVIILFPNLTKFQSVFHFYTPGKRQKTCDFSTFSGSIEMEHWPEMG